MNIVSSETQGRIMGAISYGGSDSGSVLGNYTAPATSSFRGYWGFSNGWVNNAIQRDITSSDVAVVSSGNNDGWGDGSSNDGGSLDDNDTNSGYDDWGGFDEQNDGWGE